MIVALLLIDPKKDEIVKEEFNLKGSSFLTHRAIKEMIRVFGKKASKASEDPSYKEYYYNHSEKKYRFCIKGYGNTLVSAIIGDMPSYSVLRMMDEASTRNFREVMKEYENWKEKCPVEAMHKELEETKAVLKDTLENVLNRGEKLDKLIDQSEELSMQSKALFHAAKRQNRCCKM